jgi:hypothetical protein
MVPPRTIFNFITKDECNDLIKWFGTQKTNKTLAGFKDEAREEKIKREGLEPTHQNMLSFAVRPDIADMDECLLPEDHWLNKRLFEFGKEVGKEYNRDIVSMWGAYMRCYKPGGHFVWHCDKDTDYDFMTMSIQLNKDYEGGDFCLGIDSHKRKLVDNQLLLDYCNEHNVDSTNKLPIKTYHTITRQPGSLIGFDMGSWHKVDKITKGNRYAITAWVYGNKR